TFTTGIYEAWFGMGDRGAAAQLSVALMGCIFLLLALEHVSRGGRRFHPTTTRHPPLRPVALHGWKEACAILACGMPVLLGFGIPAGSLAWLAATTGDPLALHGFMPFATNSLMLASVTASIALVLAALMAWSARMHPSPVRALANRVAALGYALPGSVIAV